MECFDLATFAMIPRWANLELVYFGKSYYVIPEVLFPLSKIIALKKDEIRKIIMPSVEGPFEEFVHSLYSGGFQINQDNAVFYFAIGSALGITSLKEGAEKFVNDLSLDVAINLANKLAERDIFDENLISRIAKSFGDALNTKSIQQSPFSLITKITQSSVYCLHNPTLFGDYVLSRVPNNKDFEALLLDILEKEVEHNNTYLVPQILGMPNIDLSKFSNLLSNILISCADSEELFPYSDTDVLNGFFRKKTVDGKNPIQQGIVEVVASSVFDEKYGVNALFDSPDLDTYFCSREAQVPDAWINIIFKAGKFRLDDYVLEGHWKKSDPPSCIGPTEWIVEGSNNGTDWTVIDDRNEDTIVKNDVPANFHCEKNSTYYSQIRIKQQMTNGSTNKRLILNSLEIFGSYIKN